MSAPISDTVPRSEAVREPLLDVRDLRVTFDTEGGTVHAVNGVSYTLREGETLVALDLEGRAPADALELGEAAYRRLGHELIRLGAEQLAAGGPPQLETLVPDYVTLPRGVRAADGSVAWSRDHR